MRYILLFLILILYNTIISAEQIEIRLNNSSFKQQNRYEVKTKDLVEIRFNSSRKSADVNWFLIKPVLKDYTNMPDNQTITKNSIALIEYTKLRVNYSSNNNQICLSDLINIKPGTYYIGAEYSKNPAVQEKIFFSGFLPEKFPRHLVQIVIRQGHSYNNYLEELLGTPFIMGAKYLGNRNQTDWRIGSDCASFITYGQRRRGINIPYCGPNKIRHYMSRIDKHYYAVKDNIYVNRSGETITIGENGIQPGDIVHYYDHVAIFYKDLGKLGILDISDLVIHSYTPAPSIIELKDSPFYTRSIAIYRWKK